MSKKKTKSDTALMVAARNAAKTVFGDKATALHALEIQNCFLDEEMDADDVAGVVDEMQSVHAAANKLFEGQNTPDDTLTLFGMILDGNLDEDHLMETLSGISADVREVFGEVDSRNPAVVLDLYEQRFGIVGGEEDEEDEDENV